MNAPLHGLFVMDDHHGQPDAKRRTFLAPAADGVDGAAMQLDEMPHDREAKADAAVFARGPAVRLPESFEDVRNKIRCNAGSCVADHDLHVRIHTLERTFRPPCLG